ncbi:hypothetical protein DOY81_000492 [Sarcophaga bullata]|nr:hypothetical protein DOY81_000492 [Sarcophaga bullata]
MRKTKSFFSQQRLKLAKANNETSLIIQQRAKGRERARKRARESEKQKT